MKYFILLTFEVQINLTKICTNICQALGMKRPQWACLQRDDHLAPLMALTGSNWKKDNLKSGSAG